MALITSLSRSETHARIGAVTVTRRLGTERPDAKTPQEAGHHSSRHRDRQARILQLRAARTWCCAAYDTGRWKNDRAENPISHCDNANEA